MRKHYFFKSLFALLAVLLYSYTANSQIAVTVDNPTNTTPNLSASYTSLANAITALNGVTAMTGPVTFSLTANGTETAPAGGYLLGSASLNAVTSATNTITFIKFGVGANPLITAFTPGTTTTTDGIWKILGTDYLTINGIDLQENSSNTTSTQQMEWGYALVKRQNVSPFDGCQNVTIQNCSITLNKANTASTGIYAGNHIATSTTALTITAATDALNNSKFYNNMISNVYVGIRLSGYSASSPYTLYDQNNEIGNTAGTGNSITNYGGAGTTSYGMYCIYQNGLMIGYNTVNGGAGTTTTLYGIFTTTGNNSSLTIRGNTVTVQGGGTTTTVNAISNGTGGSGTTNTLNMYDNIVENCTYTTATTGSMYLLYNSAALLNVNIYNNIVRNNSKSGTSGTLYVLYSSGLAANGTENVYNNSVYNNSCSGTGTVYCLYSNTVATATKNIYGNNVYGNSSGGPIHSLNHTLGLTTSIYNNKIYNNSSSSALNTAGLVKGIYAASGTTVYMYNNYISDLKAASSAGTDAIRGIEINSSTASSVYGVYFNTVYLDAASTGTDFGSSGIYHTTNTTSTTASLDMRNNIIVNRSVPNGTGLTVAYRRSDATLSNYASTSNNNTFYAGTPGASKLLFYDVTNSIQTIAALKALVSPRESASFSELPPFVNISTTPYDLHLGTSTATQCESGGATVSIPSITTDFDGNAKYPNPGYPENPSYPATAPDVGADEFGGRPQDMSGPAISYSNLNNTSSTSNRLFSNVTIIDPSSVNVNPGTAPRIYYKRTTDANTYTGNTNTDDGWKWVETSSITSPFSFTIDYSILNGGGVSLGQAIQYFVIAQDNAGSPNVGINSGSPARPLTSVDLTSDDFPITGTINSYSIISPISGEILVGTGQTYTSLTANLASGLFKAINERSVTGNLTIKITSDLTETGEVALNQTLEEAIYTIMIQPNDASLKTISGSYAGGLIRLNGADGITFDGRYSGSGNYLTFSNTSTSTNSAVFQLISSGTNAGASNNTIRNCNILGGANNVTSIFGIYAGGASITTSGTGADNDNLTIQNNNITKAYYGIYARGVATTGELDGLNILNNSVGSSVATDYITGYGMYLSSMTGANVAGNEIYNLIYDGSKYGMYIGTNVSSSIFSKNKIHTFNQSNTTTTYYSTGIYFSSATGTLNNQIDNNVIYDLQNYGSTSTLYNSGIRLIGGNGYKIYYNSISQTGTYINTTAGLSSTCLNISTASSNIDMRNNIFYNAKSGTNPNSYTIYAVTGTTFTNLNYNDYFTTGSVFGYYGAEVADYAAWVSASGEGINSKNVNPQFNSNTNLQPLLGSPVLAQGTPIAGLTTDITGVTRSGTVPSMGAYETGVDATGPTIVYSALSNTSLTSERTLTATITDISGVPTSGVGLPRLYWKINSGSYNSVQAVSIGNNQYTFTFGSGVAVTNIISYYICAQDLLGTPLVSCFPSEGASGFSASPPAVSTPPSTPSSYAITQSFSGIINVGTGGDYLTLTGAGGLFSIINSNTVTGNLTINILSNLTEDGTNALNQWIEDGVGGYTMTILPADASEKLISGEVVDGMIRFNGTDRVIIDGRFGGAGRYLRFRNTNTSNPTFTFINDASNNAIQYCSIEGSSTTTTNGIILFSTGSATGNDNNTITQNIIRDRSDALAVPYNAIYSTGSAGAFKPGVKNEMDGNLSLNKSSNVKGIELRSNKDLSNIRTNLPVDIAEDLSDGPIMSGTEKLYGPDAVVNNSGNIITNNEIFNFRSYGVYVTATGNGDGWNISNNSFYNNLATAPTVTQTAIYFIPGTNSSGNTISGNYIGGSSANCGGTQWSNSGNVTLYGMQISVGTTSATTLSNNTISNISLTGTGAAAFRGIYVTAGTVNISTNTIGHSTTPNSIQNAGTSTAYGIYITDALVNITNNEIANITAGTGSIFGVYRSGGASTVIDGCTITGNNIHDLTTLSESTNLSSSMAAFGIGYFPGAYTLNDVVSGNTIFNIHAASNTAVSTASVGIFATNNGAKITGNKIYDIKNSSTQTTINAPAIAAGILNRFSNNNSLFANNLISLGSNQTTNIQYNGIMITTGTANYFNALYNTIYIGGTATGDIPSFGFLRGDNTGTANQTAVTIANNIFYNERTGGTAKQYALANQCTILDVTGWGANASNYNLFVNPNSSVVNLWGPTDYNFADWKTNSLCDVNSIGDLNTNVPSANIFTSASAGDLSIKTGEAISWIINGKGYPIAAVNNDYAGNPRSTAVANGPTDIGAYEFTPSVAPSPAAPSGSPAPSTTTSYSQNNQQLGSISWGPGVSPPTSISFMLYSGTQPSGGGAVPKAFMYWVISPTGGDVYSYDITLFYDENQLGGIPEIKLHPAKSNDNGVTWQAYLSEGTGPGQFQRDMVNNTITIYGLTSFSWFGLGNSDTPLPVVLSSFSSSVINRDVKLTWKTESEINNAGFDVERSDAGLNQWVKAGYVSGKGTSSTPTNYVFEDKKLNSGKYNYRLKQIDNNGNFEYFALTNAVEVGLPTKFDLSQNYPNPFNPVTKIDFSLPLDAKVSIKLYDITGREVKTLINDSRTAGYYTVQFNASDLSSGTYFYRIMTKSSGADYIMTKKMMLIK